MVIELGGWGGWLCGCFRAFVSVGVLGGGFRAVCLEIFQNGVEMVRQRGIWGLRVERGWYEGE